MQLPLWISPALRERSQRKTIEIALFKFYQINLTHHLNLSDEN